MGTTTTMEADIRTEGLRSAGIPPVFYKGRNLRLLTIDTFIQELSSLVSHVAPTRVNQAAAKKTPYLLVNLEEMGRACVSLTRYGGESSAAERPRRSRAACCRSSPAGKIDREDAPVSPFRFTETTTSRQRYQEET